MPHGNEISIIVSRTTFWNFWVVRWHTFVIVTKEAWRNGWNNVKFGLMKSCEILMNALYSSFDPHTRVEIPNFYGFVRFLSLWKLRDDQKFGFFYFESQMQNTIPLQALTLGDFAIWKLTNWSWNLNGRHTLMLIFEFK